MDRLGSSWDVGVERKMDEVMVDDWLCGKKGKLSEEEVEGESKAEWWRGRRGRKG